MRIANYLMPIEKTIFFTDFLKFWSPTYKKTYKNILKREKKNYTQTSEKNRKFRMSNIRHLKLISGIESLCPIKFVGDPITSSLRVDVINRHDSKNNGRI